MNSTQSAQRLRLRRLGIGFASYILSFLVIALCWSQDMIPLRVMLGTIGLGVAINLVLLLAFLTRANLRFREPSLTAIQIAAPFAPALFIAFFIDSGQVRAAFIFFGLVPSLYGILQLNTRQFGGVGLFYLCLYVIFIMAFGQLRPAVFNPTQELIQFIALALMVAHIVFIGGLVTRLRQKLRERHHALQDTADELDTALRQIRKLARKDELTGIANRRHILMLLREEIERRKRSARPLCLCLLDMDHFKAVNDTHGHAAGDIVLKRVVSNIAACLRVTDHLGRYGGEEFLILLPDTLPHRADDIAQRIRNRVNAQAFDDIEAGLRMTVSIGVTACDTGEPPEIAIQRADRALYNAKHNGRNRVTTLP